MNKTKIEWADYTWNPVTGCLHGCGYCYARKIANRFAGGGYGKEKDMFISKYKDDAFKPPYVLNDPQLVKTKDDWYRQAPYPFGFAPTFHKYRLVEPQQVKKPQKIFVVSMGDLFGEWVPDEWIQEVFKVCEAAPQHQYIFLTKNPERFQDVFLTRKLNITKNMWFGFSVESQTALNKVAMGAKWLPRNTFISIEPLHGPIKLTRIEPSGADAFVNFLNGGQYWFGGGDTNGKKLKWVIIGQQTGPGAVPPKDEWVQSIIDQCRAAGVPVFVKLPLYEKFPIQEWPEGLRKEIDK